MKGEDGLQKNKVTATVSGASLGQQTRDSNSDLAKIRDQNVISGSGKIKGSDERSHDPSGSRD